MGVGEEEHKVWEEERMGNSREAGEEEEGDRNPLCTRDWGWTEGGGISPSSFYAVVLS